MSQMYPDEPGERGSQASRREENLQEAKRWIESWVKLTTTRGQGEYDSTHYMGVYLLPMSYLAEWAKDPAMKKRATMMLDYLIADYAAENLDGIVSSGAHARSYDRQVIERSATVSSDFGWVLFGLGHPTVPGSYVRLLSAGERVRAAGDSEAHRDGPLAAVHPLRTQADAQSLALPRRTPRSGVQDDLYAQRVRSRLGPGRNSAADPGALMGRHMGCSRCRGAFITRCSR